METINFGLTRLKLFAWLKDLKGAGKVAINVEDARRVVKLVAIVGSRKNCYEFFVRKELKTVFDDLMCPANQINVLAFDEIHNNVFAEGE